VTGDFLLEEAINLSSDIPRVVVKLHVFRLTQHRIHSVSYIYGCTTCFRLYLGYPQAYQCKTLTNEDAIRISVTL
jgi:hypothetical protein